MSQELDIVEHYTVMNKVVESMLKGNNPMQIAKELGLRRVDVQQYLEEWRVVASNNTQIQERARDAIAGADQHYALVINRLWKIVEEADSNSDLRTGQSTLKTIADVEQKRIDMLQKAGLLDNQELSHQIAETQKKQEALMNILREVAGDCQHCRGKILKKLSKLSGEAEGVVIND